jgi:prepilin-type processing-associated H-X9-DG protein
MTSGGGGGQGIQGVGPESLTFNSVAQVVLFIDFPPSGRAWPGSNIPGFWGSKTGYWGGSSNVGYVDGHAKNEKMTKLLPNLDNNGNLVYTDTWNGNEGGTNPVVGWSAGAPHPEQNGRAYNWWGTNFAAAGL